MNLRNDVNGVTGAGFCVSRIPRSAGSGAVTAGHALPLLGTSAAGGSAKPGSGRLLEQAGVPRRSDPHRNHLVP